MGDLKDGGVPSAAHVAALYNTAAEFADGAVAFITEGLARAEPVLIAEPAPAAELLRARLSGYDGQVSWADMSNAGGNPAWVIPAVGAFAAAHPGQPVRAVIERPWPTGPAEHRREAIRHEALINRALAGTEHSILCAYDAAGLDPEVITSAGQTHPVLIRGGQAEPSPGYDSAGFPPGCDEPLNPAPARAAVLAYRRDLAAARAFTAVQASRAGLPAGRVPNVVLAVHELTANTLAHTDAGGTLAIWASRSELICQVTDTGHITDPLAGHRHPDPRTAGGHGLRVVHQLCDLVQIRTSPAGTTIRLHTRLGPRND